MSPTIYRQGSFRFFFNSREETRMHVHVWCPNGMAKFWLEPIVALADYQGIKPQDLSEIEKIVKERRDDFINKWRQYFPQ